MSDAPVLARVEGHVGYVTLNRPHARNAVTIGLADGLHDALVSLAPEVAVIVVRGAGGTFSAGGDVDEVARLAAEGPAALRVLFERFGRACSVVATLSVPVVAVVEGHAMAGGFEFMQASDIALVRDDAVLADNHLAVGQVPGGGGSQRLPRLVGPQRALGHILLGDRLDGRQAVAWGLAYRSAPAEEFEAMVDAVVARLASRDREAVARTKRLVHEGLRLPLDEGLARETDVVVEHLADGAAERLVRAVRSR
ncbi:enoyl-CoA hydratase/isomerase family protein [Actinomycetospora sp. NBRC 106378]|uniref:enoyl-CoA hydratase/isomerase family protein n=1 Tax=Actinomycetospora sp. NBRC 106378 TaxID=3032208 RepID=UPI0024A1A2A7|nr:enoyl-CoA hydratase/isomerase family protein [Actinomycetospora sp. NBRC 106378]GLZ55605.1 enoyl-CoA hydratase [Actinomycetospora sp. NBRC 106378]